MSAPLLHNKGLPAIPKYLSPYLTISDNSWACIPQNELWNPGSCPLEGVTPVTYPMDMLKMLPLWVVGICPTCFYRLTYCSLVFCSVLQEYQTARSSRTFIACSFLPLGLCTCCAICPMLHFSACPPASPLCLLQNMALTSSLSQLFTEPPG